MPRIAKPTASHPQAACRVMISCSAAPPSAAAIVADISTPSTSSELTRTPTARLMTPSAAARIQSVRRSGGFVPKPTAPVISSTTNDDLKNRYGNRVALSSMAVCDAGIQ